MPKLKTHKGAAKRFKKTGTGKIVRRHAFARHILTSKSRSRKRRLGQCAIADPANSPEIHAHASVLRRFSSSGAYFGGQCAARA